MRYDKEVAFRLVTQGAYDEATGNYSDGSEAVVKKLASVMDTKATMLQVVYGQLRRGSLTVSLPCHLDGEFTDVLIDGVPYRVDARRRLRTKDVFIVSEDL